MPLLEPAHYDWNRWSALRRFTSARIALGRAGGSWRTETLLDFRLAHARARDAVLRPFRWQDLEAGLRLAGFETVALATDAADRQSFLQRPDLGRRLSADSRQRLQEMANAGGKKEVSPTADSRFDPMNPQDPLLSLSSSGGEGRGEEACCSKVLVDGASLGAPLSGSLPAREEREKNAQRAIVCHPRDLAVIVSDGLSSLAAERQSMLVLTALFPILIEAGWTMFPIFIIPFARVKLQDEMGEILGVRQTLMLLGERPGLGSPDSMGAYFTYAPGPGKTDADRNCISNIRPEGLPPREAAARIAQLLLESARLGISGVALKATTTLSLPIQH